MEQNLALDLGVAERLIRAGLVFTESAQVTKPGDLLPSHTLLRVKQKQELRGALKLRGALDLLDSRQVPPWHSSCIQGKTVLDIGASTGGFTQVLLERGALRVYALDVGTNQLAYSLRQNPKVVSFEKTHLSQAVSFFPKFDWIVADISHHSLRDFVSEITQLANPGCIAGLLVKPQFELPKKDVSEGGVVLDKRLQVEAVMAVSMAFENYGWEIDQVFPSTVKGRKGNQEYFLWAKNTPTVLCVKV